MEFVAAPHERWAELAKRMHDTEHAGDDTAKGRSIRRCSNGRADFDGSRSRRARVVAVPVAGLGVSPTDDVAERERQSQRQRATSIGLVGGGAQ
jgi:hypothetical protein